MHGVVCTNQNFLITTVSVIKSNNDITTKFIEPVLYSINKENPINTKTPKESIIFEKETKFSENTVNKIPAWVKNNAKWWAEGKIDDNSFVQGIQYLIKENILSIPDGENDFETSSKIPEWIKTVAGYWADDMISEDDFIMSIQFLIKNGIIKVN